MVEWVRGCILDGIRRRAREALRCRPGARCDVWDGASCPGCEAGRVAQTSTAAQVQGTTDESTAEAAEDVALAVTWIWKMSLSPFLAGFADELVKLGTVPGPLKQYRRARKLLEGQRTAWHGSGATKAIVEAGEITPSVVGRHGPGVYLWRGAPRPPYFAGTKLEGVALPLERAERGAIKPLIDAATKKPATRTQQETVMLFRGRGKTPEPLKLEPKDVAITEPSISLEAGRRKHRLRHIHPEIFQRAKADVRARGLARAGHAGFDPEDVAEPSVKALRRLAAGKTTTPTLRASVDNFLEDYESKIL